MGSLDGLSGCCRVLLRILRGFTHLHRNMTGTSSWSSSFRPAEDSSCKEEQLSHREISLIDERKRTDQAV